MYVLVENKKINLLIHTTKGLIFVEPHKQDPRKPNMVQINILTGLIKTKIFEP